MGCGFAFRHTFDVRVHWTHLRCEGSKGSKGSEGSEGCGLPLRAMLIKSALRDWLSVSYGMISILVIGSLRSPPPIRLCHWTRLRREGSEGSEGSKDSKSGGGALRAQSSYMAPNLAGGQRTADSCQPTADSRQRTAVTRQPMPAIPPRAHRKAYLYRILMLP